MASNSDQPKAKAANDAYTGMLAVSLFALLIGCGALYLDYAQYGSKPPEKVSTAFKPRTSQPDWSGKDPAQSPLPLDDPKDQPGKDNPDKKGPGF